MEPRIPFNKPSVAGNELDYISQAVAGGHSAGDGPFTKKCQRFLEDKFGVRKALLTTSCTDALEMSAILLDLQPGDEVIVPSYTFVSTANAFALHGARPVFADIRPDTLNIDENKLESLITPRTRAIVPVHYAGVACNMDAICAIAEKHGIAVIEDNAHGIFGRYKNRWLGSIGEMATLSFHETKNIGCGEGGALLLNDPKLIERAEMIWEKGTNRKKFLRGQVDKYTWVDVGSSFLPSDIVAAYLLAQLETHGRIQDDRKRVWTRYKEGLAAWGAEHGVQLPVVPAECEQSYHMFYLLLPTGEMRDDMIAWLRASGILSVFHYIPLHSSPQGIKLGGGGASCPVSEWASSRIVRLPFYRSLTEAEQNVIVERVHQAYTQLARAAV